MNENSVLSCNLSDHTKKEISWRKTSKKDCILYAYNSELLVVNCDVAKKVATSTIREIYQDKELFSVLQENNFLTNRDTQDNVLPREGRTLIWKFFRVLLTLSFVFSLVTLSMHLGKLQSLHSLTVLNLTMNKIYMLGIIILCSVITTILHEFMHIIFSNNLSHMKGVVKFSIKKAVAYVPLSHVWTWPLPSRLAAISAGVILDLFWLSCITLARTYHDSELLILISFVLLLRIIWQLKFHKKSDGRYFVMMLMDNPFIDSDYKNNRSNLTTCEIVVWKLCMIIGRAVDVYFVALLVVPILLFFMQGGMQ